MLGNCNGQIAPLVLYIAVDSLGEEDFFVTDVQGMSHSSDMGSKGKLVFVKKRCGIAASNTWLHLFFIEQIKVADVFNSNLEGGEMKPALYIDEEACVLAAGMTIL